MTIVVEMCLSENFKLIEFRDNINGLEIKMC